MGKRSIFYIAIAFLLLAPTVWADLNPLNLGNLPPGKTVTITFDADIATPPALGGAVTQVSNQGSLSGTSLASVLTDDPAVVGTEDPTVTPLDRDIDLRLTKVDSIDPVLAGSGASNLTYTITLANVGSNDATGIIASEVLTLPAGVSIVSITPSQGTYLPANSANGIWTVGALVAGNNVTLTVVLTVALSADAGTDVIADTVTITAADGVLVNTSDDNATEATSITKEIDLRVTKTESIDPVVAGSGASNLTYVVTVENLSAIAGSGIELSEVITVPTGVSIVSITPNQGTYLPANSANGTWAVGGLAGNASATLTVVLTAAANTAVGTDVIADTATITAADQPLSNIGDDAVTEATSVAREIDIAVSKAESIDPVIAGSGASNLVYIVTATNNGVSNASGVILSEALTLPTGVTIVSIAPSAGTSYAPANAANGNWTIGALANGASATLTVTLTAGANAVVATDSIADIATLIASNETDTAAGNNSASIATSVARQSDLAISKDDGIDNLLAGGTSTYSIVVTNSGPSDATGATVIDNFPAEIASVNWTCTSSGAASCTAGPVAGNINDSVNLPVGDSVTFSAIATTAVSVLGTVINTTTVSAPVGTSDPELNNNSAMDSNSIIFDPPSGTKVASQTGAFEAEWKLVWINSGNQAANKVRVVDEMPANSTYIPGSLVCDARGVSTIDTCVFLTSPDRIVYEGDIGPDPLGTDEDDSANEVVITFRTEIPQGEDVNNIAMANWDEDGDGSVDDDAVVQAPELATFTFFAPQAIPVLAPFGLLILSLLLGLIGMRRVRQQEGRS